MPKKPVMVQPRGDQWEVKRPGAERAVVVTDTKPEAVARARQIASNQNAELVIKNRDGTISAKDSHGNDPRPPRGSRG